MNPFVLEFYQTRADIEGIKDPFYEVLFFDEQSKMTWKDIEEMAPSFPRPWYELCSLPLHDRKEFIKSFWEKTLVYSPKLHDFLQHFFSKLDDISVVMTKSMKDSPYVIELVYSLKNIKTFFRGKVGSSKEEIDLLNQHFHYLLPKDYLAFLKIHSGFSKSADTGLIEANNVALVTDQVREVIKHMPQSTFSGSYPVEAEQLIPFYQSFGRNYFQCFYTGWFPKEEMGNVYFSGSDNRISDIREGTKDLAFFSFLDWLMFYLEEIEM